jgi:hypothetical protein
MTLTIKKWVRRRIDQEVTVIRLRPRFYRYFEGGRRSPPQKKCGSCDKRFAIDEWVHLAHLEKEPNSALCGECANKVIDKVWDEDLHLLEEQERGER